MKSKNGLRVVGKTFPRVDGRDKASGKALYTVDIELPNMIAGKILRSPYPHARLVKKIGRASCRERV